MKKIPMRMCVVTRQRFPKQDLIRVVRDKYDNVFVDTTGKQNGKGAYIKKELEVLKKAKQNKILDRVLEIDINNTIYEELENIIGE